MAHQVHYLFLCQHHYIKIFSYVEFLDIRDCALVTFMLLGPSMVPKLFQACFTNIYENKMISQGTCLEGFLKMVDKGVDLKIHF